ERVVHGFLVVRLGGFPHRAQGELVRDPVVQDHGGRGRGALHGDGEPAEEERVHVVQHGLRDLLRGGREPLRESGYGSGHFFAVGAAGQIETGQGGRRGRLVRDVVARRRALAVDGDLDAALRAALRARAVVDHVVFGGLLVDGREHRGYGGALGRDRQA